MEAHTERLVPNLVLLILVLSFATVTHGKLREANGSNGTKISTAVLLDKRNVSVQTQTDFHLMKLTSQWLKRGAKTPDALTGIGAISCIERY